MAIRLEDDLYNRLSQLADRTDRTATFYVRQSIERYIEDLEDIYLADKILSKKTKVISLIELEKELGLED